jgi:hypothetical protein
MMKAEEVMVEVFVIHEGYGFRILKRDRNNDLPYFLWNCREKMEAS